MNQLKIKYLLFKQNSLQIHYLKLFRYMSSKSYNAKKNFVEIQIPVPWGKIAAKWWGSLDKRPIVCMHGWQDNCNTYDGLIPLLPDDRSYLAIDYPGHGHSSQIPHGMFYYPSDFPVILRRIHKYFEWPQISILAHSLSANLSCLYCSIYPKDVDLFIALDGIKPYSQEPGTFREKMAKNIDLFLKYDKLNNSRKEPPAYTLDVITEKIYHANRESIDLDKCKILYNRNISPSSVQPGTYYFKRDCRLKASSIICWQHEDLKEYIKHVQCPMIMIRTTKSKFVEKEKYLKEAVDIMTQYNKFFEYIEYEGKHHAHLNEPENVAEIINKFLRSYDKTNRTFKGIESKLILNKNFN